MTSFKDRYQVRSWTGADLDKIDKISMAPFLAGSFLCMFMFDAEAGERGNAALWTGMAILAVPCALLRWWLYTHCKRDIPFGGGTTSRVLVSLFIGALLGLLGGGYWHAINAATGSSELVEVRGPVVGLEWRSGGFSGAWRYVTIRFDGDDVTFAENEKTYAELKVGDVYRTEARKGGLGYYWRSGRSFWR